MLRVCRANRIARFGFSRCVCYCYRCCCMIVGFENLACFLEGIIASSGRVISLPAVISWVESSGHCAGW